VQLRIRSKFIGILVIAAVLPLVIAIIGVQILGHHYYKRERGRLYEAVAKHVVSALRMALDREIDKLDDWVVLARPADYLIAANAAADRGSELDRQAQINRLEVRWPSLSDRSPELVRLLTNSVSQVLREFQAINPLFAEIFVTDVHGRLIAATGKTSDYWQGDELWWQRARQVRPGSVYLEGINYDDSARVFSVDVCLPIRPRGSPTAAPIGVVKAVLNTSTMFVNPPWVLADEQTSRQIVLRDGLLLIDLFRPRGAPFGTQLNVAALHLGGRNQTGWTVTRLDDDQQRLVGFASLELGSANLDPQVPAGINPMYVLVHDDAAKILAPVHRQLWTLAGAGVLILLCFALVGYYIATRKIITPIELLRSSARMIAASAKIARASTDQRELKTSPQTAQLLENVHRITTRDEIEDLARDFDSMARRVLGYHEQLEEELSRKTAEMQRDLQIAHEFQEALMPRSYPQVPTHPNSSLRLHFHHEYQAASTVGGDFFDLHKLSDHRAGIFIADVMGHGSRSALVTAILHTLLQDLATQADDPAHFLALINQHFYDITSQTNQFVFASAFYMVVDTERAIASYASAGHPPPLLADRTRGVVTPLIEHLENNPALGVFRDSTYTNFTSFIKENDVFLLFTDGLFEAPNADGEEFGRHRLEDIIKRHLDRDVTVISQAIITAVKQYIGTAGIPDDICLVAVEVAGAETPVAPAPALPLSSAT